MGEHMLEKRLSYDDNGYARIKVYVSGFKDSECVNILLREINQVQLAGFEVDSFEFRFPSGSYWDFRIDLDARKIGYLTASKAMKIKEFCQLTERFKAIGYNSE